MNKQDMELWVKALRSGEYKQGTIYLHDANKNSYCCLGVLNKILPEKYLTDGGSALIPSKRFKDNLGRFTQDDGTATNLARLNDNGTTFNEIADIIEKYYKEL